MSIGLSESATIGILLLLIFGAVSFYLYSRINYTEKRMGLMENMLLDIKVGLESMNKEEPEFVPEPVGAPQPMDEGEALPEEETYYQSVLKKANEALADAQYANAEILLQKQAHEYAQQRAETQEEEHEQEQEQEETDKQAVSVNYESMTKDELIALAEKRGAKTGKRPGRKDLIASLKKLDESKGDVAGNTVTGELFPLAASVNDVETSGFPVDLGAEIVV